MLKSVLTAVVSFLLGLISAAYTLELKDEKLRFELSEPARFGDVVYQNLRVSNTGWDPATNVKIAVNHPVIRPRHAQSTPPFSLDSGDAGVIGGYDRLRRGETVTVAFSFKGRPIEPAMLAVKSDRSLAAPLVRNQSTPDFFWLLVGLVAGAGLAAFACRGARPRNGERGGKTRR